MGTESTRQHAVFLYKCNNEIEQQKKEVTIRITGTSWKESAVPSWWIKFWAHAQKQKQKKKHFEELYGVQHTFEKTANEVYALCLISVRGQLETHMYSG